MKKLLIIPFLFLSMGFINAFGQCNVSFTANTNGNVVDLVGNPGGAAMTEWYIDWQPMYPNQSNVVHTFPNGGVHTICYYGLDSNGVWCDSTCQTITLAGTNPVCQADFYYQNNPTTGEFFFSDVSFSQPGPVVSWYWTFGDGNFSYDQYPVHQYLNSGVYNVCLEIITADSCWNQMCQTVTVQGTGTQCNVSFTANTNGNVVDLVGNPGGAAMTEWYIDWQPMYPNQNNVVHTFPNGGVHTICYYGLDSNGVWCDSTCQTITLAGTNPVCQADFYYQNNPTTGEFFFSDISFSQPGPVVSWYWTFGDGNFSYDQYPVHQYLNSGVYNVCLEIITADSCWNQMCQTVTVQGTGTQCNVSFTANTNGNVVDLVGNPGGAAMTEWYIDWQPMYPNQSNVVHTFPNGGVHTICYYGLDSNGVWCDSTCQTITLAGTNPVCQADFYYQNNPTTGEFFFSDISFSQPGPVVSWYWTFGDGNFSYDQYPVHQYLNSGVYNVCLEIITADSCWNQMCQTVTVQGTGTQCNVSFTANTNGNVVDLVGNPGGAAMTEWYIDWQPMYPNQSNVVHTFPNGGVHTICYYGLDSNGVWCDSTCQTITLAGTNPVCQADFYYQNNPTTGEFFFSDISFSQPGPVVSWYWTFGDGNFSYDQYPVHEYLNSGVYNVCLEIITADSCWNQMCQTVTVQGTGTQCNVSFTANTNGNVVDLVGNPGGAAMTEWYIDWQPMYPNQSNVVHTFPNGGVHTICYYGMDSNGVWCDSTCQTITLAGTNPVCQADFYYQNNPTTGEFFFSDASSSQPGPVVSWYWTFGDGNFSYDQYPVHQYLNSGVYNVCLEIITADSCWNQMCQTVTVQGTGTQCNVSFTANTNGNVVDLVGNPGGAAMTEWYIDWQPMYPNQSNVVHTFPNGGVHTICYYGLDSNGVWCDSTCQTITIAGTNPVCQADFYYQNNPTTGEFFFSDISFSQPGPVVSWYWTFGDGNFSYDQYPVHQYLNSGVYNVCLEIITADSCWNQMCQTVTVQGTGTQCNVSFTANTNGNVVDLVGNPGGAAMTEWYIDWQPMYPNQSNVVHTFPNGGVHTICYYGMDSNGVWCDSTCQTITLAGTNPVCQADFYYQNNPTTGEFFFSDASSSQPGPVVSWYWTFGDGTTDFQQWPVHTYATDGWFEVCLTIETADSCMSTICDSVFVQTGTQNCNASFSHFANENVVDFINGSGSINLFGAMWDFGDGTTSNGWDAQHVYAQSGSYTACLYLVDANGMICDSTCQVVTVTLPQLFCVAQFLPLVNGNVVTFVDQSSASGNITNWSWDFGDSSFAIGSNPSHIFPVAGVYDICLTITTDEVCASTYCVAVEILGNVGNCQANFTYVTNGNGYSFSDNSYANTQIMGYEWDFGDGAFDSGSTAAHSFQGPGPHMVCLTIITTDSCMSTACDTVLGVTSLENVISSDALQMTIYPVPVRGNATIEMNVSKHTSAKVSIFNLQGKSVFTSELGSVPPGAHEVNWETNSVTKGIYLVRLEAQGEVLTKKIIVE